MVSKSQKANGASEPPRIIVVSEFTMTATADLDLPKVWAILSVVKFRKSRVKFDLGTLVYILKMGILKSLQETGESNRDRLGLADCYIEEYT